MKLDSFVKALLMKYNACVRPKEQTWLTWPHLKSKFSEEPICSTLGMLFQMVCIRSLVDDVLETPNYSVRKHFSDSIFQKYLAAVHITWFIRFILFKSVGKLLDGEWGTTKVLHLQYIVIFARAGRRLLILSKLRLMTASLKISIIIFIVSTGDLPVKFWLCEKIGTIFKTIFYTRMDTCI